MKSAVAVMWQRQIKEYFRNRQRLIVSLVQPLLFLVAFGFGLGNSMRGDGNTNYVQYLLPGIVTMTIMMSSTMTGMGLIWDKKFGFLKETLVAPVSRTSLLFGRCLGGATTSTFQGVVVLFLGYLIGFRIFDWSFFPLAILTIFLIALLFNLVGTSLASKFDDMQSFPSVMNFLMMPMMFLSSAFFSTENFPRILNLVVRINPFNYCVILLRYFLSGILGYNIFISYLILLFLILFIGILGTWFFRKMEA